MKKLSMGFLLLLRIIGLFWMGVVDAAATITYPIPVPGAETNGTQAWGVTLFIK